MIFFRRITATRSVSLRLRAVTGPMVGASHWHDPPPLFSSSASGGYTESRRSARCEPVCAREQKTETADGIPVNLCTPIGATSDLALPAYRGNAGGPRCI